MSDAWVKQAKRCLQVICRAAGARGDRLRMKSRPCKTNGHPKRLQHDACMSTWNVVASAARAPSEGCGVLLRQTSFVGEIATPRWLHTRNSLLSELPDQFGSDHFSMFAQQPLVDAERPQEQGSTAFASAPGLYESRKQGQESSRTKISMTGPFDSSLTLLVHLQPTRLGQTACSTNDTSNSPPTGKSCGARKFQGPLEI